MDETKLVRMANDIARNFAAQRHEDAVAAVADHITMFWEPRMKAGLYAADRKALLPLAAEAVALLERGAKVPSQTRATRFNAADESHRSDGA
ncbi:formate dehydrogenase subunit delta [Novosphingobium kunmingense]|uniref:Formate dehydrogenase subunit delta n=1 Tax=Novosphingobium kunmingense TaxID=1211806 RepID=A0A2N0H381_9SPHN|nr:formate dehydrogenase subunit delta [Novosphingobium kunmingense]PKB13391.1 formate dehydrogenase subunit delta [Novosphingobium kunmingense]